MEEWRGSYPVLDLGIRQRSVCVDLKIWRQIEQTEVGLKRQKWNSQEYLYMVSMIMNIANDTHPLH
jgi:hypothetical protein